MGKQGAAAAAAAAGRAGSPVSDTAGERDTEGPAPPAAAPTAAAGGPPDPLTFSYGVRDCIGQNLARIELSFLIASFVARFSWTAGAALQQAVSSRCAEVGGGWNNGRPSSIASSKQGQEGDSAEQDTAEAVVRGVLDQAAYHITLAPRHGMFLLATPRA
jgi:hypothetical protein